MVVATIQKREAAYNASQGPLDADRRQGSTAANPGGTRASDRDHRETPVPDSTRDGQDAESEEALVDQAGRTLGNRAIQTRQRILDATVELLEKKSLRDLKVIDIARRIGSSPATFYQYFKDVEDVVLHVAESATSRTPVILDMIHGDWSGPEGYDRARFFIDLGMRHWDEYRPILRARNTASDEGDQRFSDVRAKAIMPMIMAFAEEIEASQRRAAESGEVSTEDDSPPSYIHPTVGAFAIFSLMDRLAMYRAGIEALDISREEIVDTIATLFQTVLTSRK
jgi:AcrR family transcriptional regulator